MRKRRPGDSQGISKTT